MCFEPNFLTLPFGIKTLVKIHAFQKNECEFSEDFYCWISTTKSKLELVKTFKLKAIFVDPKLEISNKSIKFYKMIGIIADECEEHLKEMLTIKNVLKIPLKVALSVSKNFFIECIKDEKVEQLDIHLEPNKCIDIIVGFWPQIQNKRTFSVNGKCLIKYHDHPKVDVIDLCGEIFYPTVKFGADFVDFGCIRPNVKTYYTIILENISPLTVHFTWKMSENVELTKISLPEVYSSF